MIRRYSYFLLRLSSLKQEVHTMPCYSELRIWLSKCKVSATTQHIFTCTIMCYQNKPEPNMSDGVYLVLTVASTRTLPQNTAVRKGKSTWTIKTAERYGSLPRQGVLAWRPCCYGLYTAWLWPSVQPPCVRNSTVRVRWSEQRGRWWGNHGRGTAWDWGGKLVGRMTVYGVGGWMAGWHNTAGGCGVGGVLPWTQHSTSSPGREDTTSQQ